MHKDSSAAQNFYEQVYSMVEQIPNGSVATYGQIARLTGFPRRARQVGYALHVNPRPGIIPCHRVVFADGKLSESFAFGGSDAQRSLLHSEGVVFRDEWHVDLKASRWQAGL